MRVRLTPANGCVVFTEYSFTSYNAHVYHGVNRYVFNTSNTTPFENLSGIRLWGGRTYHWDTIDADNIFSGCGSMKVLLR